MGLEEIRRLKEQALLPKAKKVYQIPKKSAKKIAMEKLEQKVEIVKPKKAGWFDLERVKLDGSDELSKGIVHGILGNERYKMKVDDSNPFCKSVVTIAKEMDSFWKNAEKVIARKPYCWECGDFISKSDYRNSTAHIFPKSANSGFPSVAADEWNFVVAGVRCGCHNKTHRLDTFSQMKIFPVAVARFMKFHHLITEKRKYLDLFIDYANAII
jgi:5-methylcytosine-specific restriction endonuclease McrA